MSPYRLPFQPKKSVRQPLQTCKYATQTIQCWFFILIHCPTYPPQFDLVVWFLSSISPNVCPFNQQNVARQPNKTCKNATNYTILVFFMLIQCPTNPPTSALVVWSPYKIQEINHTTRSDVGDMLDTVLYKNHQLHFGFQAAHHINFIICDPSTFTVHVHLANRTLHVRRVWCQICSIPSTAVHTITKITFSEVVLLGRI